LSLDSIFIHMDAAVDIDTSEADTMATVKVVDSWYVLIHKHTVLYGQIVSCNICLLIQEDWQICRCQSTFTCILYQYCWCWNNTKHGQSLGNSLLTCHLATKCADTSMSCKPQWLGETPQQSL
jgi:hypothetical protein